MQPWILAVHGGAGGRPSSHDEPAHEEQVREGIAAALAAGAHVLSGGGSARSAVVAAVEVLEAREVFNAGFGSVLTAAGKLEMDAAVMDGACGEAGAVAGVRRLAHPVRGALAVLEHGPHVLLAGEGAEAFAAERGVLLVDPLQLVSPRREEQLRRLRERAAPTRGHGTVGAVARDAAGHLAAATSTGGIAGRLPGRISDSCLIGAGTWADDATCAVSATGEGDFFIRRAFAHEVDALLRHAGLDVGEACARALARVRAAGGRGGAIAVDAAGRATFRFDTPLMSRGRVAQDEEPCVALYPHEPLA